MKDLSGDWRRSLLSFLGGLSDTSSHVSWLQGPSLFCDLRQPRAMHAIDAGRLRTLSIQDVAVLAAQEGFAGRLVQDGGVFEWVRWLDFQPPFAVKDRGSLAWDGDVLVETGCDIAYIEHWHRDRGEPAATSSLRLHDPVTRRAAILVVAGDRFAFARDRGMLLPSGRPLSDLVSSAPSLAVAQDMVDCEISQGFVDGWIIERSTLPWRGGQSLSLRRDGEGVAVEDVDPDGRACRRTYDIIEEEVR